MDTPDTPDVPPGLALHEGDVPPPKRPFPAWRFWAPPLLLSALIGSIALLLGALEAEYGWTTLAVPIAVAAATSYRVPGGRGIGLALALGAGLIGFWLSVAMAVRVGPMGPLCGAIFGVLGTVPALLGAALGVALRKAVIRAGWVEWRWFYSLLLVALVLGGPGAWLEARLTSPSPPVIVSTAVEIEGTPDEVWRTRVFSGDETADASWLGDAGLPSPEDAAGGASVPGDLKRVALGKGHVLLRIVESNRPRVLRYEVVEQRDFEDRTARLLGGSLRLDDAGQGRTSVTVTTTYEPLLGARAVWGPVERFVADELHRHLLREVQRALDAGEMHAPEPREGP